MLQVKRATYDLEERTARFGESVIIFSKKIPLNPVTQRIIPQLVASATAVGSNYCEADDAESGRDFVHKLSIGKKEAREAKHWLRMVATAVPELTGESRALWKEANELNLIFNAIIIKVRDKQKARVGV